MCKDDPAYRLGIGLRERTHTNATGLCRVKISGCNTVRFLRSSELTYFTMHVNRSVAIATIRAHVLGIGVLLILSFAVETLAQPEPVGDREAIPEDVYSGETRQGRRHGFGRMEYSTGDIYEGNWVDDLRHGSGVLYFNDGRTYEGTFFNDNRTGEGILRWSNGDTYEGTFVKGAISGLGRFHWEESGASYEGFFLNGRKEGRGEFRTADGRRYLGSFHNDEQNGSGTLYWPDQSIFRGEFRDNKQHGVGIYTDRDGLSEFQLWDQGSLLTAEELRPISQCQLHHGEHEWMFLGSDCFNGLAHGSGVAVNLQGTLIINPAEVVLGNVVGGIEQRLVDAETD